MSVDAWIAEKMEAARADEIYRVDYGAVAERAHAWAKDRNVCPAATDERKIALFLVDAQNAFCVPGFELFVGGRSGHGAVEDSRRLVRFLYENLEKITTIAATLDTHRAAQVFHPLFLVDKKGEHPEPMISVSVEDVRQGRWRFNEALAPSLGVDPDYGQDMLLHYVEGLAARGRYSLTVWPYHAMLGGISHALVSAIEEAMFFHSVARHAQPHLLSKGSSPWTEHYSVLAPEVLADPSGRPLAERSRVLRRLVESHDEVYVAGQAKSHCVAWTIEDLIEELEEPALIRKLHLLDDACTAVVVPGIVDYSGAAESAFERFARAGALRVTTRSVIL